MRPVTQAGTGSRPCPLTRSRVRPVAAIFSRVSSRACCPARSSPWVRHVVGGNESLAAERQATQTVVAVVNAPEPAPVSEPEPYTCLLPKARMGFENTCLTSPQTPEFSINIDWQPRFETHIAGVAAAGIFAEIRVKITNLSGRTWHGLTPGSFFLMEDFPDSDVAIEYRIWPMMWATRISLPSN